MDSRRRALTSFALLALAGSGMQVSRAAATASETRELGGFDELVWQAVGELRIEQTGRERLHIEAEPDILAKIFSEVHGRRLTIGFRPGQVTTRQPIRMRLELSGLDRLEARSSGDIRLGALKTAALVLRLSGSDNLLGEHLEARTLDVRMDGSGSVSLQSGHVASQHVVLAGSGSYDATGMSCGEADIALQGSGRIAVFARDLLAASISGSGEVAYLGEPRVRASVTGAGAVRRLAARKN